MSCSSGTSLKQVIIFMISPVSRIGPSPMEGKNGLKIVCDSGAGFSTEQADFSLPTILQKKCDR